MDLHKLYPTGRLKRWHTTDLPAQTIGHHSWGVALVVATIYPRGHDVPAKLMLAALTHDCAEAITGDIPSPAMKQYPELGMMLAGIERRFNVEAGIEFDLTDRERAILKWADTFECAMYAEHIFHMGVLQANFVLIRARTYLKDMGFPTSEARELYGEVFDSE